MASRSMSAANESSSPSSPWTSSHAIACDSNTVSPGRTSTRSTTPATSAAMTCSIFIASITNSCCPRRTRSPTATSMLTIVPCIGARTTAAPSGSIVHDDGTRRRIGALAVMEHRERVATVQLGAGQPPGLVTRAAVVPLGMGVVSEEEIDMVVEERRRRATADELGQPRQVLQHGEVRADPLELDLAQRPVQAGGGIGERRGRRVDDDLRRERVVARVGRVAGVEVAVATDSGATGRDPRGDRPATRLGRPVGLQRLHVDPSLDRHAPRRPDVAPGPIRAL